MMNDGRHGVGLDRVAEVDTRRDVGTKLGYAIRQQASVIGEKRGGADSFGEHVNCDPTHAEATGPGAERGYRAVGRHAVSSSRSRARSNLPLGDRGSSLRTSTSFGSMYAGSAFF